MQEKLENNIFLKIDLYCQYVLSQFEFCVYIVCAGQNIASLFVDPATLRSFPNYCLSMRTENIRLFHEKKINLLGSDFLEKNP